MQGKPHTLILTLLVIAATASQALAGQAVTEVTFRDASYGDNVTLFSGDVSSAFARCERERRIRVFRQVDGPDSFIGAVNADRAQNNRGGRDWDLVVDGYVVNGRFYAKAAGSPECKGARSSAFVFNDCMPTGPRGGCRAAPRD
jgi:hypothetical protein